MLQQLLLYIIAMNIHSAFGSCSVARIIMRVPREHDIGIIFDLTMSNSKSDKSEVLSITVNSDDICTLNMTNGEQVKAGTIFGGDFGSIEPGNSLTVSLVWPTASLYNRVGSCPIIVSTTNHKNEMTNTKQILYFDTRLETLDPDTHSLRRKKEFIDCKNWDKNYFHNCTPLNCEERYFGKRSFYNRATERCDPVPFCFGDGMQYDFYGNECVDTNNFITDEEIEHLKHGKFDNNLLNLMEYGPSKTHYQPIKAKTDNQQLAGQTEGECILATKFSLVDFNNIFQHLNEPQVETPIKVKKPSGTSKKKRRKSTNILRDFYYDWYLPLKVNNGDDDIDLINRCQNKTSGSNSILFLVKDYGIKKWTTLFLQMLLLIAMVIIMQVVITILTYIIVCIILCGFLEFLAELRPYEETTVQLSEKLTPRRKDKGSEIMTSASLMSQLK